MNAMPARRPTVPSAEMILQELTTRQFVRPHRPLAEALADAGEQVGFSEATAVGAAAWLDLNPAAAMGRLRRTELAQLAHSIHRSWCQAATAKPSDANAAVVATNLLSCAGEGPL